MKIYCKYNLFWIKWAKAEVLKLILSSHAKIYRRGSARWRPTWISPVAPSWFTSGTGLFYVGLPSWFASVVNVDAPPVARAIGIHAVRSPLSCPFPEPAREAVCYTAIACYSRSARTIPTYFLGFVYEWKFVYKRM